MCGSVGVYSTALDQQGSTIKSLCLEIWPLSPRYLIWAGSTCVLDFPDSSVGKESTCNAGDPSWIPGAGRSAGERIGYPLLVFLGFPCDSAGKEATCNAGDLSLIPGMGLSSGEGECFPLQYSGLENSMYSHGSKRVGHDWATFTTCVGTRKYSQVEH